MHNLASKIHEDTALQK
jgi:hypothetical protein